MLSILTMKVLAFLLVTLLTDQMSKDISLSNSETSLKSKGSLKQFPEDSEAEPTTNDCD